MSNLSQADIIRIKTEKVDEMEASNQRTYEELQGEVPNLNMDTGDMRRELFIEHLVQWGVITVEQKLDFELEFHGKVERALAETWRQIREQRKAAPKLHAVKKPAPKLIGLDGQPLT